MMTMKQYCLKDFQLLLDKESTTGQMNLSEAKHSISCGKPVVGVKIQIISPEDGRQLKNGQVHT